MTLGFIGLGNMASAIIGGILKQGMVKPTDIIGSDIFEPSRSKAQQQYDICVTADNGEVASAADILFLAVKPQFYADTIHEIKDNIKTNPLIVSIAPGKTLQWLSEQFAIENTSASTATPVKLIRTMPNTPAMVGAGMTGVCPSDSVTTKELETILELLRAFGKAEVVSEHLMDVVVSVSGSAPAYVFLFIEAMADAAVADGMARPLAYEFAAQAVLGSAKMVLETGKHPGELKDMVCSPGGTTIEAVRLLEREGLRSAVIEAMKVCAEKSRGM